MRAPHLTCQHDGRSYHTCSPTLSRTGRGETLVDLAYAGQLRGGCRICSEMSPLGPGGEAGAQVHKAQARGVAESRASCAGGLVPTARDHVLPLPQGQRPAQGAPGQRSTNGPEMGFCLHFRATGAPKALPSDGPDGALNKKNNLLSTNKFCTTENGEGVNGGERPRGRGRKR